MENMETENIFTIGDWLIPSDRADLIDHMVYGFDSITKYPDYFEPFYYLTNYYLFEDTQKNSNKTNFLFSK